MSDMNDDRWSIRGVPKSIRHLAGDLARREGMALGPWLTRLIERTAPGGMPADPVAERLRMLEAAVGVLCERVTALEIDQEVGGPPMGEDAVEEADADRLAVS